MSEEHVHELRHRLLGVFPLVKSFIVEGQDLVLVDTGITGGSARTIERGLASIRKRLSDVDLCVITHAHRDHVGGLKALKASGQPFLVAAHEDEADDIESATGVGVDMRLVDGQSIGGMTVVYVPGHTLGSIALHTGDSIIVGDALTGGGGGLRPPSRSLSKDWELAKASLANFSPLDFDNVYVSHGKSVISGGKEAMAKLVAELGVG